MSAITDFPSSYYEEPESSPERDKPDSREDKEWRREYTTAPDSGLKEASTESVEVPRQTELADDPDHEVVFSVLNAAGLSAKSDSENTTFIEATLILWCCWNPHQIPTRHPDGSLTWRDKSDSVHDATVAGAHPVKETYEAWAKRMHESSPQIDKLVDDLTRRLRAAEEALRVCERPIRDMIRIRDDKTIVWDFHNQADANLEPLAEALTTIQNYFSSPHKPSK